MKLRGALLAATVLVAPVAANAQAVSGVYIGAGAGVNFMQDSKISGVTFPAGSGVAPLSGGRTKLDPGMIGVVSVGYGLGNGLRLEIEGGVRQNKFSNISGSGTNIGGDEDKYTGMFNVLYDFNMASMGFNSPIIPYVGAGAGYAWAQDHNFRASNGSTLLRTNSGEGSFAYQAIIGAALPIASIPGLAFTLEYRFMGLASDRTYNEQYFAPGIATRGSVKQTDDFNHSVLVGVRYAFNAAPAAVMAAPVPVAPVTASRTYLVFFDWDRADLTDRARQIIAEAAQATTKVAVTRIEVSGHTDTTGTAKYNQGLSVRRAQNVAAELVRLGVPKAAITTQGFGFSKPLVATGPNVREPQNRRVEIVLK